MKLHLRLTENGSELWQATLSPGTYTLGRLAENDLVVESAHISRRHLSLEVGVTTVVVADLGSTNGVVQDGRRLPVRAPARWTVERPLQIGPLQLHGRWEAGEAADAAARGGASSERQLPAVTCAQALPPLVALDEDDGVVTIGSAAGNSMRINLPGVAPRHCVVRRFEDRVEVIHRAAGRTTLLNGETLPADRPVPWQPQHTLQIGSATCRLSAVTPAQAAALEGAGRRDTSSSWLIWGVPGLAVGAFLCLLLVGAVYFFALRPGDDGTVADNDDDGVATPTLGPTAAALAGEDDGPADVVVTLPAFQDQVTATPGSCEPADAAATEAEIGFLDLPFPYEGLNPESPSDPERFRLISRRSRFGGRINSFFDHEFPVYPPAFGGREPAGKFETLLLFDGTLSVDNFSQDANSGDWYSGHSGIDYSPVEPLRETTPILAAAAGRLYLVQVDSDGNHMVWLTHDPDGDGRYQYATLYFHLAPDLLWDQLIARYAAAEASGEIVEIASRERLGTMGTTGRSTGIHLHFEVRHDVNGDNRFTWQERVDPYGFFPSEVETDPWAEPLEWVDSRGNAYEHEGIESQYLWVHPLIGDVVDEEADDPCQEESGVTVQTDLYDVTGFVLIHTGFTLVLRNEAGQIIDNDGLPHFRNISISAAALQDIDRTSVTLEYFDATFGSRGRWVTVSGAGGLEERPNGSFVYRAEVERSGRYVIVGRPNVDIIAPETRITLEGTSVNNEEKVFRGPVRVTLDPVDVGDGVAPVSGIRRVEYSLDCGETWEAYSGPFMVAAGDGGCGSGTGETIALEENEIFLLAIATDITNNVEQPASQVIFTIE